MSASATAESVTCSTRPDAMSKNRPMTSTRPAATASRTSGCSATAATCTATLTRESWSAEPNPRSAAAARTGCPARKPAVDGAACSIQRSIVGGTAGEVSATPIAPHAECPQTMICRTASSSTANDRDASSDGSAPAGGTRLPTLRTVNRSPGPLPVMTFGTTRESAQVRNSASGFWPPLSWSKSSLSRAACRRW